ncbi:MAG: hypothetical protein Q8L14_01015 [Myxococcales bacterium]|nr:hypothetical protein [Myxococcales bacterium]
MEVDDADAVLSHLVTSGLIDRLTRLTLDGPLTDEGLDVLFANTSRFAALETLTLDSRSCSTEPMQRVATLFPRISRVLRIDASAWID